MNLKEEMEERRQEKESMVGATNLYLHSFIMSKRFLSFAKTSSYLVQAVDLFTGHALYTSSPLSSH